MRAAATQSMSDIVEER